MPVYAGLLRNVNVGPNRIDMAALRGAFVDAGCTDVTTYLQSGNVVFRSDEPPARLIADLEARVAAAGGFDAAVIVRTPDELAAVVRGQPWAGDGLEPTQLVVVFCRAKPPDAAVGALRALATDGEEVEAVGRHLYLRLPHGQGRSKLAAGVARLDLGGPVTARNWRTVTRLLELAETALAQLSPPARTRRGGSTTGRAASAGSPPGSPPTPPDARAR